MDSDSLGSGARVEAWASELKALRPVRVEALVGKTTKPLQAKAARGKWLALVRTALRLGASEIHALDAEGAVLGVVDLADEESPATEEEGARKGMESQHSRDLALLDVLLKAQRATWEQVGPIVAAAMQMAGAERERANREVGIREEALAERAAALAAVEEDLAAREAALADEKARAGSDETLTKLLELAAHAKSGGAS